MQAQDIPVGLCQCGCGQKTRLAPYTHAGKRWTKGQPLAYCLGHQAKRRPIIDYTVEDRCYETPCWIWRRALTTSGYGSVMVDRKMHAAHRLVFEKFRGPIPPGLDLDHLCRNKPCVNPDHLEPVTNAENVRRGDSTPLTWDQVREIKAELEQGAAQAELGRRFGVSRHTIWGIAHGYRWTAP